MSLELDSIRTLARIRFFAFLLLGILFGVQVVSIFLFWDAKSSIVWPILLLLTSFVCCVLMKLIIIYVKSSREKLNRLNIEKYHSIIEISQTGAWEHHLESGYVWCSTEYFAMLGYTEDSFRQHHAMTLEGAWINLLHPEDKDAAIAFDLSSGELIKEHTFRMKHKAGHWVWIRSRSRVLTNVNNKQVVFGTHIDITEKVNAQVEAIQRGQRLKNFAYALAHEVRGPVARILGLTNLTRVDDELTHEKYLALVAREADELDGVIRSVAQELERIEVRDAIKMIK